MDRVSGAKHIEERGGEATASVNSSRDQFPPRDDLAENESDAENRGEHPELLESVFLESGKALACNFERCAAQKQHGGVKPKEYGDMKRHPLCAGGAQHKKSRDDGHEEHEDGDHRQR